MMKKTILAAFSAAVLSVAAGEDEQPLNILADLLQVDPATRSLVASGNVAAVHSPFRMLSDYCARDAAGVYRFGEKTMFTTCTNDVGCLHWSVSGGFEYSDGEYATVRDGWVRLFGLPLVWMPYLRVPLWSEEGLRIMPGYIGNWGPFVMTRYGYHLAGTRVREDPDGWGLDAATRFDLRYEKGLALGQEFQWRLGEFGFGEFKVYYAWDVSDKFDTYCGGYGDGLHHENWGSDVDDNRYGVQFKHRWDITERDVLRVAAAYYSDSYFRYEYLRSSMFMIKNQFLGYDANEAAWEHNESWSGLGLSVSGPLNDFIDGTTRLPELYFDVSPLPVFGLPVNYESENRVGYLRRQKAEFGFGGRSSAFSFAPGPWADYESARFDTYHRLTAPMKFADVLSVVPRLAYRGTFWGNAGGDCPSGWEQSENVSRNVFRSILEGGITFAARGTADYDGWRHMVEPYLDVLAQKAWYSGLADGARPYVFDAVDASRSWSDQFASRGRNLPYTWYGLTPGLRNVFDIDDGGGSLRRYLEADVYCVLQCNDTEWLGDDRGHKLSEPGRPNYGERGITPVPGFRLSWYPAKDVSLAARLEYDSEENTLALGGIEWRHRLSDRFEYHVDVMHSDFRYWDFSSLPYDPARMSDDEFNFVRYTFVNVGFEHEICDAVAWGPYIRWDCRCGELDSVGSWIDYRTDCLGFRLLLEYEGEYTRIDGSRYDDDFSVGFYIYLRAFGADSGNLMHQ